MRHKIMLVVFILLFCSSCVNYANVGLPRGINGKIMNIIPGSTNFAYITTMYGPPIAEQIAEDGSKNSLWTLDTSYGICDVYIGFTQYGIVNWYNYIYRDAVQYRK